MHSWVNKSWVYFHILMVPVTVTKLCFHCVGTDLLNFPERCEIVRKTLIFFMKTQGLHGILSHSDDILVGGSMRANNTFTALSQRSQCMHCTLAGLKTQCWRRSDIPKNAVQFLSKCHGRPRGLHNNPCAPPLSSYCVAVQLWWPNGCTK